MSLTTVTSFYLFVDLIDVEFYANQFYNLAVQHDLKGTILLSKEGINAGISGKDELINKFLYEVKNIPLFEKLEYKIILSPCMPFKKLKVKVKSEIITFKQCNCNPLKGTGKYILPKDWNSILQDPEFAVIDARNDYEVQEGTFIKAINPHTQNFAEFAEFIDKNFVDKNQKIAMFCTGGIRCEKATAYLVQQGYNNIYQLHGGILNYFKYANKEQNMWHGKCFVFDQRLSVSIAEVQN